jgi:hypothetical protein
MAGPFKCKRMRIIVIERGGSTHTLGVVEAYDIELIKEGGVTPHYDSETGKHAIGTRPATFRLRRWFMADTGKEDLLYDLMQAEIPFNMSGEISNVAGSVLTLSACMIYSYAPRTGGANDIVAEEARGEATDWFKTVTP